MHCGIKIHALAHMVDQIVEEGVPAYTDTVATEKANHQTVVTNFAKLSKRVNTFLKEMSDSKNYSVQSKMLFNTALLHDSLEEKTNSYLSALKNLKNTAPEMSSDKMLSDSDIIIERVPNFGKVKLFFDQNKQKFFSGSGKSKNMKETNELKKSLHPFVTESVLNELLIQYSNNVSKMWPQLNAEALQTIMASKDSNFKLYLEKGCAW